ncbi:hypothetical protein YC2023_073413 [Brassica napus]
MGKCGLGYIRLNCSSILMYCFFSRNSIFKLSGGRLRPGESGFTFTLLSETQTRVKAFGLTRMFLFRVWSKMKVGECIGTWWRPNFKTLMYPFLPPNVKHPKECLKLSWETSAPSAVCRA